MYKTVKRLQLKHCTSQGKPQDTRTKRLAKFKFIARLSSDTQRSLLLFLLQRYKQFSNSMFVE